MGDAINHYRNLNNFYKVRSGLSVSRFSSIDATIKPITQFSAYEDLKMPFQITGRLVTASTYKDKNYGRVTLDGVDLKESLNAWVGIPIYTSHAVFDKVMRGEDVSINEIVGKITKVMWNSADNGIDFYADVFDKQVAFKMANGLIKYISVGFAREVVSRNRELFFTSIEPKEASLVFDPRDKNAEFKPVNT
jgi:hypothetical protein